MDRHRDNISAGQLASMVWVAVLGAAVGVLPGIAARSGGMAGWLAPLLAAPALLAASWLLWRVTERGGQGLAAVFCRLLGGAAGRLLTIIYIMWGLLVGAARLRLSGQRLVVTGQRDGGLWFFLPVIAFMVGWMAWGKLAAFARTAVLFRRGLLLTLGGVVALTAFQIRKENLLPLWLGDLAAACRAAVPALGVLCVGVYGAFALDGVKGVKGDGGRWTAYTLGFCSLLALFLLAVLGNLGGPLTAELEDPFITLSKNVGVEGAFQRVESLVSALWLLADLTLLALLVWACRRALDDIWPAAGGVRSVMAAVALLLLGAGAVFPDAAAAQRFEQVVAPAGNLVLGLAVPAVLFLVLKVRRK